MKRYSRSWASALFCVVTATACGPHTVAAQAAPAQDPSLPPPDFGSLKQDQIGINLATEQLRIRVIPLDEHVIRMLAPDAYHSLHDMAASRAAQIAAVAHSRGLDSTSAFMVTFFGMQPQVRFNPDDLNISSEGTTFRPIGYVPITPRFSENRIDQREQAAAIYLFEPGLNPLRRFTVIFGVLTSDSWASALELLNTERARVLARASSAPSRP